jgi:hypothetical protein
MTSQPIEVECYAGGRSDERPSSVTIGGLKHTVARLLSESIEERVDVISARRRRHRYRVFTEDGLVLELIRMEDGSWFLDSL